MSKRRELAPARARRRPYSPRQRKKRFLLYCEGEVTERDYFRDFARFLRSPLIEVKVAPEWRKDPKRLVELAKEARGTADRDAKSSPATTVSAMTRCGASSTATSMPG